MYILCVARLTAWQTCAVYHCEECLTCMVLYAYMYVRMCVCMLLRAKQFECVSLLDVVLRAAYLSWSNRAVQLIRARQNAALLAVALYHMLIILSVHVVDCDVRMQHTHACAAYTYVVHAPCTLSHDPHVCNCHVLSCCS